MNVTQDKNIIVFLGPTLSIEQAKDILPGAHFLPPVQCGDIIHTTRLQPDIIIMIDGFFEHCSAVWHKEILFAMEKNITVIGASSMGALRAAELKNDGIIGVGEIYKSYASGELTNDDEVAILHAPKAMHYLAKSQALVNWRATFSHAIKLKLLEKNDADHLVRILQSIYYPMRTIENFIQKINELGLNKNNIARLIAYIKKQGIIDQKKQDAIEALNFAKNNTFLISRKNFKETHMPPTLFARTLIKQTFCQPFPYFEDWLPQHEKIVIASRLLNENYRLSKRLAYLIATTFNLEHAFKHNHSNKIKSNLIQLTRLSGDYKHYSSIENLKASLPLKYNILYKTAQHWTNLQRYLNQGGYKPSLESIKLYSKNFKISRKLENEPEFKTWLIENNLDECTYHSLITMLIEFDYFVIGNNSVPFNIKIEPKDDYWLKISLIETGAHEATKQLLSNSTQRKAALNKIIASYNKNGAAYLNSLDLKDESELKSFFKQIEAMAQP